MITRLDIERARGTVVAVDGGILLEYVRASRKLAEGYGKEPHELDITGTLEKWEIAHTTLCGNLGK